MRGRAAWVSIARWSRSLLGRDVVGTVRSTFELFWLHLDLILRDRAFDARLSGAGARFVNALDARGSLQS